MSRRRRWLEWIEQDGGDSALDLGPGLGRQGSLDSILAAPGGEREARRALHAVLPWTLSIAVHVLVVALLLLLGTRLVERGERSEEAVLIVAEFEEPSYAPVTTSESPGLEAPVRPAPPPALPAPAPLPALRGAVAPAPSSMPAAIDWSPPQGRGATFAGAEASDVRRIAYVVDASGSMVGSLAIVLDELERSLGTLAADQQFAVLFFQRNNAVAAPPGDRFAPATPEQVERTLRWARQRILPSGRSNPVRALESALRLRPDVIFLLSTSITGSGQFEIDQGDLLRRLEGLNPADASGRRRTRIQCLQFLDPDPLDALRRIAEIHGGPGAYRFLSRSDLGVAPK